MVFENAKSRSIFSTFNIEMYTFWHGLHEYIFIINITVTYTHNTPVNVNPQGGPPGQTQGILTEAKIDCQIPLGESPIQCV